MKLVFYFIAVITATVFISANASAQYGRYGSNDHYRSNVPQAFYYYPQSNVYFSCATNQYIYNYRNAWLVSDHLPRRMRLDRREPRFVVNHYGFDVWNDNYRHVMQFRNYRHMQPDVAYNDRRNYNDDHRPHDGRGW